MILRKVQIFDWERIKEKPYRMKVPCGVGVFHRWGCGYDEYDSGPGNYATAVVELEDGTVKNHPVELIQFRGSPISEMEAADHAISPREYFAAMAMQALITSGFNDGINPKQIVSEAYVYADEMICQREK